METPQTDPLAIAALVCGIFSWLVGCCGGMLGVSFFALPFAILSIILGALSIRRVNAEPALFTGKEFGIVGLVMGILNLLASLALIALLMMGIGLSILGNSGY